MTFLKIPVGEKSFGRIFFVYKIPKERIPFGYKVASSLAKRVSWLKFEPRSRIFPEVGQKVSKIEESTIKF